MLRGQLSEASPERASRGGADISFITRIRLIQRGIQVYKSASFRIGHPLLERFGDPGVVVFYDEFRDLCAFAGRKGLELLNDFSGAHTDQNTARPIRRKIDALFNSQSLLAAASASSFPGFLGS